MQTTADHDLDMDSPDSPAREVLTPISISNEKAELPKNLKNHSSNTDI